MKKFLLYFFAFVFICFLLPAMLTRTEIPTSSAKVEEEKVEEGKAEEGKKEATAKTEEKQDDKKYDYKKYGTVQLLHKETGQVESVELDTYLVNVVSAEMPVDYEIEALKAQAVVARTYTIYKINNKKHENADICDDSNCCQAWISKENRLERWEESKRQSNWAKIEQCVKATKRKNYYISKSAN